ncbi:MAG: hypothetical protein ABJA86_13425 [Nocardioidaceae bacterium]
MNSDDLAAASREAANEAILHTVATELRGHTDDRWVAISDDVLSRVMCISRPSHPVRAQAPRGGYFHVSEQVLVASLQHALDEVPHCEVTHIQIQADGETYTGVTIIVTAQYRVPLISLADQIRGLASGRLTDILGPVTPEVTVSAMHVHIEDVTPGDPKRA